MDIGAWFSSPCHEKNPDERTRELCMLIVKADSIWRNFEREPEKSLQEINSLRARAEALEAPCFAMLFGYWACEIYTFYLRDLKNGLDYAMKLVVEARKPLYENCPAIGLIYRTTIAMHIQIDAVGYAAKIEEMLDFLERDVPIDRDTFIIIEGQRAVLAFEKSDFETSKQLGRNHLAMCEDEPFRLMYAHLLLLVAHFELGDIDDVLHHAVLAEENARVGNGENVLLEALAWQAYCQHQLGEISKARHLYRQSSAKLADLEAPLSLNNCLPLALYLEHSGEPQKALDLLARAIIEIEAAGRWAELCECHLVRCRILGRMGETMEDAIIVANTAAEHLLDPSLFHAKLKRIEKGDYSR